MKDPIFVIFPFKGTGWVAMSPRTFDFWRDTLTPLKVVPQIFFH